MSRSSYCVLHAWAGTAVGAVGLPPLTPAAPRTDGDAIVIRSPPPRPSRYGMAASNESDMEDDDPQPPQPPQPPPPPQP
eukprot:COSAG01_NODE_41671_length_448_cov_2.934097_1_plen_78_part_01